MPLHPMPMRQDALFRRLSRLAADAQQFASNERRH